MIPYTTEYAISEFAAHGEIQLLQKLPPMETIFDVGCNIGEWSRMARNIHTGAHIHMFEMVPATFDKMINNGVIDAGIHPNNYGLSDSTGIQYFRYTPDNDRVATRVVELNHTNSFIASGFMVRGDEYCAMRHVNTIDFLKLDTEGHEYHVLRGFGDMIGGTNGKIRIIQFEYGYTAILTKNLLVDFYRMLQDHYVIGRLTPQGVHFKDYHLLDEDFKGPDYVAVHKEELAIIEAIRVK